MAVKEIPNKHKKAVRKGSRSAGRGAVTVTIPQSVPMAEENGDEETPETPLDETMVEPIDDLSSLEGEGYVRISRILASGEPGFLKRVERSILAADIGYIGRIWGGGVYRLEVFQSNPPRWVRKFSMTFDESEYGPPKGNWSSNSSGMPIMDPDSYEGVGNGERPYPLVPPVQPPRAGLAEVMLKQMEASEARAAKAEENMMELLKTMLKPKDAPMEEAFRIAERMHPTGSNGGDTKSSRAEKMLESVVEKAFDKFLNKDDDDPVPSNASFFERMAEKAFTAFTPFLARVAQAAMTSPALSGGTQPPAPRQPALTGAVPPPPGLTHQSTPTQPAGSPIVSAPSLPPGMATSADILPVDPAVSSPAAAPVASESSVAPFNAGDNGRKEADAVGMVVDLEEQIMVQTLVGMLLRFAGNKAEPAVAADAIVSLVGDASDPKNAKANAYMDQLLEKPDGELIEYLSAANSAAAVHGEWLIKVANELRKDSVEEPEAAIVPAGEGG